MSIVIVVVALFAVGLVGALLWNSASGPPAGDGSGGDELRGFTDEEVRQAALNMVYGRMPHVFPSYLGGRLEDVASAKVRMAGLRAEYADFKPDRLRREIMGWLDWRDCEIERMRVDIVGQVSKKGMEEYAREADARERTSRMVLEAAARSSKKSTPPAT